MDNIALIVGGDHHNGLNLARALGVNGVIVHAFVVCDFRKSFISKSKYIKKTTICKSDSEAFDKILQLYTGLSIKPVIFPYSDSAAFELDSRLNAFKDDFIVPSINGEQGRIAEMMDKQKQYEFAKAHNINIAESASISLVENTGEESCVGYPCILKPIVSANGKKSDISICNDKGSYVKRINELRNLGYTTLLIQEYLKIDYEIDVVVAFLNCDKTIFLANKIIRRWPHAGGTTSFSTTICDSRILKQCESILEHIRNIRYFGLADVEFFLIDGTIYLNEINWRNSGGGHRSFSSGFFYPFWYMQNAVGEENGGMNWKPYENEYAMTEYTDIRNVVKHYISFSEWMKDKRKTKNLALKFKGDMKPCYNFYFYRIIRKIFK